MRSLPAARPFSLSGLVCACALFHPSLLPAQSVAGVGGSIGVTSDYVYRGVSLTTGNPALQADLHYQSRGGWIVGAWGSHADLSAGQGAESEIDLYIGRNWKLNPEWELRTTLTHYSYPEDKRFFDYAYDEVVASLGFRSRVFATVALSPNFTAHWHGVGVDNETAVSYEMAAVQPLIGPVAASAGVGYYDLPAGLNASYWFWNAGLACAVGHTQLTVSYIDTDQNAAAAFGYAATGSRWAGSVAWRF